MLAQLRAGRRPEPLISLRRLVAAAICAAGLPIVLAGAPAIAAPPPVADRYALLVGIDAYAGKVRDNVGAVGDVNDMREVLVRNGWPAERIRVLTDARATAPAIRAGLKWLVDSSSERSMVAFHYSGHVKQMSGDRDRDGEDLDEYLWPVESDFISDGEVATSLRRLKGWAWVSIAGCEAAGFDDGVASRQRLFTAASQEVEKGYEDPRWRNSVFTGLLADLGMLRGYADADKSRRISIQEAFAFAAENAPEMTARQAKGPQHPYIAGGDGSPWYLDSTISTPLG